MFSIWSSAASYHRYDLFIIVSRFVVLQLHRIQVYDLDGRQFTEEEIVEIYSEALDEFKSENPGFIGSKIIYAPVKKVSNETAQNYFKIIPKLHARFPNFLAGFDMAGQEDVSPSIIDFLANILQVPKEINFYMHAGETNWFGSTDENLVSSSPFPVFRATDQCSFEYFLD